MTNYFSEDFICDMCDTIGQTKKIRILSGLRFIPASAAIKYIYSDVRLCLPNFNEHKQKCYSAGQMIEQSAMCVHSSVSGDDLFEPK